MKSKSLVYLAAVPVLIVNAFFVAKLHENPVLARAARRPEVAVVSALFVLMFALPSFLATVKWLGARRGILLLALLSVYATSVEVVAVCTGLPYGRFHYGSAIGAKVLGTVPWTVPFAWTPLLLGVVPLAHRWAGTSKGWRVAVATTLLIAADAVIDPGAVAVRFWGYLHPGAYYGVPLGNYCGWALSAAVGALLFDWCVSGVASPPPATMLGSLLLILCFWSSVCLWSGLWIAGAVGLLLLATLARFFVSSPLPSHLQAASTRQPV